jgi:hypothetical protein
MVNHFHLLLEVPPMVAEACRRILEAASKRPAKAFVAVVAAQERRSWNIKRQRVEEIHKRFTHRMHHLGEFA